MVLGDRSQSGDISRANVLRQRVTDSAWITDADYRAIGRALAAAMVEYFNLPPLPTGVADWTIY